MQKANRINKIFVKGRYMFVITAEIEYSSRFLSQEIFSELVFFPNPCLVFSQTHNWYYFKYLRNFAFDAHEDTADLRCSLHSPGTSRFCAWQFKKASRFEFSAILKKLVISPINI
ncbi:MAG: hypothetical protein AMJ61_14740 [Desulfobacterales bacterium SG8_35_2]|nr:MAG: hypothetical protein AMJ61_14740 [Desulfobacterales bacterium SG8_35_2]